MAGRPLVLVWAVAAAGIVLVLLRTENQVVGLTRMLLYLGPAGSRSCCCPSWWTASAWAWSAWPCSAASSTPSAVVVLVRQRPDPKPTVFGYHEVWHALTLAAEACHFAFIWLLATAS